MGLKEMDLHLTNSCSLRCGHCVFSSGERDLPEMDSHKALALVDEFADLTENQGIINIFGGEVLLREDIEDIIHRTRSQNLALGITTNCNVPEAVLNMLMRQDIQRITSDLDGATPETHDWLRNKEGNFKKVLDVLKLSVARKIFTTVNSVLSSENVHEVEDILALCERIGIHGLAFYYLTPTGRGKKIADKCLDAESWIKAKKRVEEWIKQHDPSFAVCWEEAYEETGQEMEGAWRCEKGHTETIFIRCDSEVYSCALLEGSSAGMGNVNQDSLAIILARREEKAFGRTNGCPALAFHTHGDLSKPDPRKSPEGITLGCPYNYHILNEK